ncbi:MAG: protein kinase, partial [Acidobacteria bacterium]|nr:protein kinase [Acidobacteriota bacterium]
MPSPGRPPSVSTRSLKSRRSERYELREHIGTGGMGTVYRALDRELNRTVAVKLLRPELVPDLRNLLRLKRELVLASRVSDEHVVRVHDIGEVEGRPLIAMDWVEGESLAHLLNRVHCLPPSQTCAFAVQICKALRAIHAANIVHRDLKPGNLLIRTDGEILLGDFGLARSCLPQDFGLTGVGECGGTVRYMAPEQLAGLPADARSDLHALGIVLLEMLTGTTALEALASLRPRWLASQAGKDVRSGELRKLAALDLVIRRCLCLDRTERYASAEAVLQDLQMADVAVPIANSHEPTPGWRMLCASPRARKRLAACLALALLLSAVWLYLALRPDTAARTAQAEQTYAKAISLLAAQGGDRELRMALQNLDQVVALNPNHLPAARARLQTLIQLYEGSHDPQWLSKAREAFTSSALTSLSPPERKLLGATIDFNGGAFQDVIRSLQNDSNLLASSKDANLLLGRAIEASGGPRQALPYYRAATRLSPESWRSHNDLGYALLSLGQLEESREEFIHVIQLQPNSPTGYASLGVALLHAGSLVGARQNFEAALERAPSPEGYYNLGVTAYYSRDYATSIPFFESAIRMRPNSERDVLALADVLRRLHRTEPAREAYMRALSLLDQLAQSRPLSLEEQSRRALCFAGIGDRASAQSVLDTVPVNANNPHVAHASAVVALPEGRMAAA